MSKIVRCYVMLWLCYVMLFLEPRGWNTSIPMISIVEGQQRENIRQWDQHKTKSNCNEVVAQYLWRSWILFTFFSQRRIRVAEEWGGRGRGREGRRTRIHKDKKMLEIMDPMFWTMIYEGFLHRMNPCFRLLKINAEHTKLQTTDVVSI